MDLFNLSSEKLKNLLIKVLESYGDEFFNREGNFYFCVTPKIDTELADLGFIRVTCKDMQGGVSLKDIEELYYPNYEQHYNMVNISLKDLMIDCMMEDSED